MLKTLWLRNFQKHADLEITFSEGLNLVVGKNWAGKTTIQRAILYALFGTSAVPIKSANLIRLSESSMDVELSFRLGKDYVVKRGTKGAVLFEEGAPPGLVLASGQTAVTSAVEQLLGTSAKDFVSFNVARQFEAANILTLGSAKLSAHMENLCNVRLIDDAVQWLRIKISEAKEVEQQTALVQDRLEALAQQRPHFASEVGMAQRAHEFNVLSRDAAQEQVSELSAEIRDMAERVTVHATRIHARRTLHGLLERLPDVPALDQAEIEEVGQQLEIMRAQASLYTSALSAHRHCLRAVSEAEAEASRLRLQAPETLAAVEPIEEAYSIARTNYSSAEAAWFAAQRELDSGGCHACGRPFEHVDVNRLQQAVADRRTEMASAADTAEALRLRLEAAQDGLQASRRYHEALRRLSDAQQRLEDTPEPDAVDESALAELAERHEALRVQAAQHAERARVLEQWYALPDPGPDEGEALKAAHVELERRRSLLNETGNAVLRSEFHLKECETALRRADAEAADLRARAEQAARIVALTQARKKLVAVLVDNRESFMAGAWQRLLDSASEYASEATNGEVRTLQREEDAFFFTEVSEDAPDGELRPIELASGHQQAVLGVGIKLALSRAVGAAFDVVLLDEVSAGATDELSLMMTRALRTQVAQCVLISHRQADAAVADCVIAL